MHGVSDTPCLRLARARAGFTLIEMIITLVVIAILAAAGTPMVSRAIGHSRVNNTAGVIAGDLQLAFSLAGRQRAPLRLVVDPTARSYRITNRVGAVIRERLLGNDSDLRVSTMSATVTTLDIFPNGLSSGPIAITIGISGYTRTITMSRVGQVRVSS
jgi:prepilin-type N-terminal cleavage/methylation domain-containing protein